MQQGLPRRRRPRALPDAPIDFLLARSRELAGGWLIALVEELPLEDMPRIPLNEMVAEGPELCDAVVRALADDAQLRRLQMGGAMERVAARAGEIAGANGPESISAAVDALRSVIWGAMREAFADPTPDQLFELGERLALVGELVRAASLRAWTGGPGPLAVKQGDTVEESQWEERLSEWIARAHERSTALALMTLELDDVDRLLAISSPEETAEVLATFEAAIRATAGETSEVLAEAGRAWVIVPGLSRARAWGLSARLASAIAAARPWRGAPLRVSVGIACLGQNGDDAPSLVAAAEESRFAAEAGGVGPGR